MVTLIQSENHAANKGKMAGRYQFDNHPTRIGLKGQLTFTISKNPVHPLESSPLTCFLSCCNVNNGKRWLNAAFQTSQP